MAESRLIFLSGWLGLFKGFWVACTCDRSFLLLVFWVKSSSLNHGTNRLLYSGVLFRHVFLLGFHVPQLYAVKSRERMDLLSEYYFVKCSYSPFSCDFMSLWFRPYFYTIKLKGSIDEIGLHKIVIFYLFAQWSILVRNAPWVFPKWFHPSERTSSSASSASSTWVIP